MFTVYVRVNKVDKGKTLSFVSVQWDQIPQTFNCDNHEPCFLIHFWASLGMARVDSYVAIYCFDYRLCLKWCYSCESTGRDLVNASWISIKNKLNVHYVHQVKCSLWLRVPESSWCQMWMDKCRDNNTSLTSHGAP